MSDTYFDTFDFDSATRWHLDQVRKLRAPTGLFTASAHDVAPDTTKHGYVIFIL